MGLSRLCGDTPRTTILDAVGCRDIPEPDTPEGRRMPACGETSAEPGRSAVWSLEAFPGLCGVQETVVSTVVCPL